MIRVCLLDDDASCLMTVGRLIKKICRDCEVRTFVSPHDALDHYVTEDLPDFVLSDFKMPMMNGVSFIDEMRKLGYNGPAYIFTGRLEPIEATTPISGIIQKPLQMDVFREILRSVH